MARLRRGAHRYFQGRAQGLSWAEAATALFDGAGSFGNGAAMRAGPLGAFFGDDLERAVAEGELAARERDEVVARRRHRSAPADLIDLASCNTLRPICS